MLFVCVGLEVLMFFLRLEGNNRGGSAHHLNVRRDRFFDVRSANEVGLKRRRRTHPGDFQPALARAVLAPFPRARTRGARLGRSRTQHAQGLIARLFSV